MKLGMIFQRRRTIVATFLFVLVGTGCRDDVTSFDHRQNRTLPQEVDQAELTDSLLPTDEMEPTTDLNEVGQFDVTKLERESVDATQQEEPQTVELSWEIGTIENSIPLDQIDFQQWPRPDAALFVTGRQYGYIEPCGCTGLDNQKGGLSRRHTLLQQVQKLGWPVVSMDVGNQVRRFGGQPQIKFHTTVEGFRQMGYHAVTLGPDDLRLSFEELLVAIIGDEAVFVSANVDVIGEVPRFRVVEAEGVKIGITAILGESHHARVQSDEEVMLTDPVEALASVWPELESAQCDLYVLLAHATLENSQHLGRNFPEFDLVVTAGGAGEPTYQPQPIEGSNGQLVQVGVKGMYVGLIAYYRDIEPHFRYQRIALDATWKDSTSMIRLLGNYQKQLEDMGLENLGLRPVTHPSGWQFVGTERCGECHTTAYKKWLTTPHAHATETLVRPPERYEVPRHFDPECLSCHVTGWNPQGYFPYASGYLDLQQSIHLHGNGCENCHGPGSRHVAVEEGEIDVNEQEQMELRRSMRLSLAKARESCLECHDLDNSPDFHVEGTFEEYWKKIEHKGMD